MKRKLLIPSFRTKKDTKNYRESVFCGANRCAVYILSIMLVLAAPVTVLAEEEDYLDQLAAEADNTSSQTKVAKTWDAAKQKQFKQMEKMLANDRPTTYKFYKKLTNEKKEKVLNIHISKNKLSITSKTIMDLYFSN